MLSWSAISWVNYLYILWFGFHIFWFWLISDFGQLIQTGRFQQYDHDFFRRGNKFKKSKPSQPEYNLKNVNVPVALYYSDKDWLSDVEDVRKLKSELPNVIKDYLITESKFNHMDILWGNNAPTVIFDVIFKTMKTLDDWPKIMCLWKFNYKFDRF